jgi:hypothetical protein
MNRWAIAARPYRDCVEHPTLPGRQHACDFDPLFVLCCTKAVPLEFFRQFFEVKIGIKPTEGFDHRQFDLPDSVHEMVRQAKPSVTLL